jgi:hypothetical protein
MDWLRKHMREHLAGQESCDHAAQNVLPFRSTAFPDRSEVGGITKEQCSSVEDLVFQLAEVIRRKEDDAAQKKAWAESLAQCALDELCQARTELRSSEIARKAAEAAVNEANAKAEELERALMRTEGKMAAAEAKLAVAVVSARNAEARAARSEKNFGMLEEVIRQQLLETRSEAGNCAVAA